VGTNRTPAPDRSARASSGQLGWWSRLGAALGFLSVSAAPLLPQGAPSSAGALTLIGSARARGEAWNWFDAGSRGKYVYAGATLRVGATQQWATIGWQAELEAPLLLGLPDDAVLPAPAGQLGLGGTYFAANDRNRTVGGLFLKQAFVSLGRQTGEGHRVRLGRFVFQDGGETAPTDPTLAAVKRSRVSQRLIGGFGFSHVQRSFDGLHYVFEGGGGRVNLTAIAARATQGVFKTNGWPGLEAGVAYGALTTALWPRNRGELRVFAAYYRDWRDEVVKTDNRPVAERQVDRNDVTAITVGGHYLHLFPTFQGPIDLMLWGAAQTGMWGRLDHRAHAGAVEVGIQPDGLGWIRPWLRAGLFASSGDPDPTDSRHQTFFQVLPTPQPHARFPFHNLMNLQDAWVSLTLRPASRVTLRSDLHTLRLTERSDLWYLGGGAFDDQSFGYVGRASEGGRHLADVWDLSVDVRLGPQWSLGGFVAWAKGATVIRSIYGPGDVDGSFGYLEVNYRP